MHSGQRTAQSNAHTAGEGEERVESGPPPGGGDEQGCQTDKIEFEIEEEDQADETSEKQMHQMVIARMISGPGGSRRGASTASETFESVL